MPGWIWLVLVVFMLAMLATGVLYVVVHAVRAVKKASAVGDAVSSTLGKMSVDADAVAPGEPAIFTQPLSTAADRYSQAHAQVIRRQEARRNRYAGIWSKWLHFND